MATTGTRLLCGAATLVSAASTIVGQGAKPELWVLYSLDDVATSVPVWADATAKVRGFTVERGRDNELARVDAGTATITVDAKDRVVDPFANPAIRPMNQWWIRSQFSGVTEDIFKGYAESYETTFPDGGWAQALTVVSCVDEFKPLTLALFAATDPPRESYQDLVMFDEPSGYWTLDTVDPSPAAVGGLDMVNSGPALPSYTTIVGSDGKSVKTILAAQTTTPTLRPGDPGDMGGLSEFTVEVWFRGFGTPTATEDLVKGPDATGATTWRLRLNTSRQFIVSARNSAGTEFTATSTTTFIDDTDSALPPYHIVGTVTGGNLRLYVNNVEEASTAFTGPFAEIDDTNTTSLTVGNPSTIGALRSRWFDELAVYRNGLTAARVTAHYTAGVNRGFATGQLPGARIDAILDYHGTNTPRSIRPGTRTMSAAYMRGQPLLEEIRAAEAADAVDAVFFVAKDGALTFLDDGHRSSSPWNTVQATFDDDSTDLPYLDLTFDYSDAFLANTFNVTRVGGLTASASDAASVAAHGSRPGVPELPDRTRRQTPGGTPPRPETPITLDADAAAIAAAMLAKYKNPFTRITSLSVNTAIAAVTEAVLGLDLGDRIRVFKTHPGGGSRIDQTLFVHRVEVSAVNDQGPWTIRLGVSPL